MAKGKLLVGLDIGSSGVKVCQLKENKRGQHQLRAFGLAPMMQNAIVDGVIMNGSSVVDTIKGVISRNRIRQKDCAISVSGYSVIVKRIPLPIMTEQELESNLQWEVEHHIPFDVSEVYIDKQILGSNPQVGTMDVLLVAAKREMVDELLELTRQAGLNPRVVDVSFFCLQNAFEMAYPELAASEETIALLDVGSALTSIIVLTGGVTAFTRDLSQGGDQLTEGLQKALEISREQAESYKLGGGDGELDAPPDGLASALTRGCESLAQDVERSLAFFLETSGTPSIDRVLLMGGGAKLPMLTQVLERQLTAVGVAPGLVDVGNPFASLQYDPKVYNPDFLESVAPMAAVSVGLALRRTHER